jgi:ABC-type polysaccharide/polyol phosphate transport system ATPase subunit
MIGNAIEVRDLGKCYSLGRKLAAHVTLQETIAEKFRVRRAAPPPRQEVWALRDLSFEAREGEALGVIGHNGAGKTTLLKILSRITQPTTGVSRTRGRVGALLDVGSGFHMELTGRENVFLNGTILGMKRREIRRRYDEIVDFAGLERYMDTPIKRYSWGMHLRLAFAIAAHVEPEIMLVDEVLAVGDLRFREKCIGKMSDLGREGRTVVFISHDLGSINQVCRRTIWLDHGEMRADGPSGDVIDQYVRSAVGSSSRDEFETSPESAAQLLSAAVVDEQGQVEDAPRRDEPLAISVRFLVRERIPGLDIAFSLTNQQGVQVLDQVWGLDTGSALDPDRVPVEYEARMTVPPILAAGDYILGVWIGTRFDVLLEEQALRFRLWPHPDDQSKALERNRVVQPDVGWEVRPVAPTRAR